MTLGALRPRQPLPLPPESTASPERELVPEREPVQVLRERPEPAQVRVQAPVPVRERPEPAQVRTEPAQVRTEPARVQVWELVRPEQAWRRFHRPILRTSRTGACLLPGFRRGTRSSDPS